MTLLHIAVHVLLRTAVLTLGLVAYDAVYELVVEPTPDADIGKGLLAFMLVILVSLLWSVADGMHKRLAVWLVVWVLTAAAVGLSWDPVAQLFDGSREDLESSLDLFMAQLVLWPALLGGGFGWLVYGRQATASDATPA